MSSSVTSPCLFTCQFFNTLEVFPPTPEVARDRPTPSTDPEEEVPVVGGKKVHKHYWPLPTDVEIGKQFEA
jgi:hypothetical protein